MFLIYFYAAPSCHGKSKPTQCTYTMPAFRLPTCPQPQLGGKRKVPHFVVLRLCWETSFQVPSLYSTWLELPGEMLTPGCPKQDGNVGYGRVGGYPNSFRNVLDPTQGCALRQI